MARPVRTVLGTVLAGALTLLVTVAIVGPTGSIGSLSALPGGGPSRDAVPLKADAPLRWPVPELESPEVIALETGATHSQLDPTRDYVVVLPAETKTGYTWIEGGRNVVIQGGRLSLAADDPQRRAMTIDGATGTVHVEGVLFEGDGTAEFDAIAINAPQAIVQIQNVRVTGLVGTPEGNHSDVIQPWGGVRELRIDRLTGTSNYQGLFLPEDLGPIGSADIERVNLAFAGPNRAVDISYLIWLTGPSVTGCQSYPVRLVDVYVAPRPGQTAAAGAVWPTTTQPSGCAARAASGEISWPSLPTVEGSVHEGTPPDGDFVPDGTVGLTYRADPTDDTPSPPASSATGASIAAVMTSATSIGRGARRARRARKPVWAKSTTVRQRLASFAPKR